MATINKNELSGHVAEATGLSNARAKQAVGASLDVIIQRVAAGDEVNLAGFGKFGQVERSAPTGKNPATGETIQIAAGAAPKFSAASAFQAGRQGQLISRARPRWAFARRRRDTSPRRTDVEQPNKVERT